ncbi:MAG: mechanosensitive ion channel [Lachnospiraceae bacterium]|nr:mechanosensitive ion channel [Candidatus Equihabitans merdae]
MGISIQKLIDMATSLGGKILLAIVVLIVGNIIIKMILKCLNKTGAMDKIDITVAHFVQNFVKCGLYVVLFVSIIGILGVPMASIVTVMASAGVAIGLALQGALSNLAGGIMILVFRPFNVDDYVEAAGVEGTIKEVHLFYTVFITVDNKRITVPNGSLMNANVTNYSSEPNRRVDLKFACAKSESPAKIQAIMMDVMKNHELIMTDPEPFARISGGSNEAMEFTVRAWCKNDDYWTVYFDLNQKIVEALGENGVQGPAVRVVQ